jgi:hypothetical protein
MAMSATIDADVLTEATDLNRFDARQSPGRASDRIPARLISKHGNRRDLQVEVHERVHQYGGSLAGRLEPGWRPGRRFERNHCSGPRIQAGVATNVMAVNLASKVLKTLTLEPLTPWGWIPIMYCM